MGEWRGLGQLQVSLGLSFLVTPQFVLCLVPQIL